MFEGWISREEEAEMPKFNNHKEAQNYFSEKYGKDFILETVEKDSDGKYIYFHALITNWENYRRLKLSVFERGVMGTGFDLLASYQPIQISEDGSVHIVH